MLILAKKTFILRSLKVFLHTSPLSIICLVSIALNTIQLFYQQNCCTMSFQILYYTGLIHLNLWNIWIFAQCAQLVGISLSAY